MRRETTTISPVTDIVAELKAGRMVVLVDEEDRENEGDLILAAEHVTPEAINFMAKHARGLICLTLTEGHCRQIDLPLMVRCALACAPAQAHAEVRAVAHHVTAMPGGQGAAREFCDLLLMARGHYAGLLAGHLTTLDDAVR